MYEYITKGTLKQKIDDGIRFGGLSPYYTKLPSHIGVAFYNWGVHSMQDFLGWGEEREFVRHLTLTGIVNYEY